MKKYGVILLLALCALPAMALENKTLAFYQREAIAKGKSMRQDKQFAAALARDVAQWVNSHEENAEVKQALLMQTNFYTRAQQDARALLALYQVRFYYPSSQDVGLLSTQVDNIMDRLQRNQKARALQLLATDTTSVAGLQARKALLLTQLAGSGLKKLYIPVCELFEAFFTQYPKEEQTDKLLLQYGDWHRQNENYLAAILEYKKVYELYPASIYRAASLRMTADVYAADLKDYETASALYNQVLKEYPQSSEKGIVYKHIAVMEENRKDYAQALAYYDKAITELGGQSAAFEAWQGKADVLAKTKEYQAAYDTFVQGAGIFAAEESNYVTLLAQAAEMAARRLKNPALETAALEKILLAYPQTSRAPEFLYQAGQSYEKQGKPANAVEVYKQLVVRYPTEKYASRAQGRLNKLEK